jgi:hypothetical protein
MVKKLLSLLSLSLLLAAPTVSATELDFSTAEAKINFGTAKLENYNVAVNLGDAGFTGLKIKRVEIPIVESENISNYSVFLSSKLAAKQKVNVADIATYTVTPANGKIVYTFDEPYTIPEEGVYLGYSFEVSTLDDVTSYPVPVEKKTSGSNCGFWILSSRTYYKWLNKADLGYIPAFNITFDGDFKPKAASLAISAKYSEVNAETNSQFTVPFTITNYGTEAINSVDLDYSYGSESGTVHVALDSPIPASYTATGNGTAIIPTSNDEGSFSLKLTLSKVNGSANEFTSKIEDAIPAYVYEHIPVHRPVMEEYTGAWCGYCPRGFAAMQYMNKHYENFIGMAYHNSDAMQGTAVTEPSSVSGYPYCWMDRTTGCDPYYAESNTDFGIEDDWTARAAKVCPVDVDVEASFDTDNTNIIKAKAYLTFIDDHSNASYKLSYALVADDLHCTDDTYAGAWAQSNYFSGYNAANFEIEEMAQFCNGASSVYGLHFDDVVIMNPSYKGISNSVPSSITKGETIESDVYTFNTVSATSSYTGTKNAAGEVVIPSTKGQSLVQDRSKLHVVALVLDSTGKIVNAAKANVTDPAGVNAVIVEDADVIATEYFDLAGRKVAQPAQGLYIKRMTLSNGQVKTLKTVVK